MKKILQIILVIILINIVIFGCFIIFGRKKLACPEGVKCEIVFSLERRGLLRQVSKKDNSSFSVDLVLTPIPTIIPTITPTPTLTPEQIAEIKRKQFAEMNTKYGPCKSVPILMYHHVLPSAQAKEMGVGGLNVDNGIFSQQMDYLQGKGYQTLNLEEMIRMIKDNSLPSKPIVLTFDDGYRDFYTNVFPLLKEKGIKATAFVISQFTGGDKYLLWGQISEMAGSGLVTIGDHTLNHTSLGKLDQSNQADQIVSAKNIIESNIGKNVNVFAYPYGNSNTIAKQILTENGFSTAVTTIPGTTQCAGLPFDLQRIRIGGASLANYGL